MSIHKTQKRIRNLLLVVLPGLIVTSLVFAANIYFDLDTGSGRIMTWDDQEFKGTVYLGALEFAEDSGEVSWIDMSVTSAAATGTVMSYTAQLDSQAILTVYAEATGDGQVENLRVGIGTTTPAYTLDVYGNARLGTSTASSLFFRGVSNFNSNFYINTSGIVATGTWQGTPIAYNYGGTGTTTALASQYLWWGDGTGKLVQVASSTLAGSGGVTSLNTLTGGLTLWGTNNNLTVTASSTTGLVFDIGTDVATTGVATLSSLTSVGTIATGTWQGTPIGVSFGGTGTSTNFTTGSIIFAGANGIYSQNNANLFWDNTNSRLGIGTTTPAYTLDTYGTFRALSTSTFGGYVGIGTTTPAYTLSVVGNIYGSGNAIFGGTLLAATTTIAGDLLPAANLTYNIGSASAKWANIYAATTTIGNTLVINTDSITATSSLNLTGAAASTWQVSGGALIIQTDSQNLTLQTATSGTLAITSAGNLTQTFAAGSSYSLIHGATARLAIDSSGNITATGTSIALVGTTTFASYVGIATTTTPTYPLTVQGNIWGSGNIVIAGTIDTGQGATEVYLMNQNVGATDSPTFANLIITNRATTTELVVTSTSTLGTVISGAWQGTPIGVSFGGTGTSTNFTTGSIIFAGANGIYSQNNAKLFWDNTNLRLGIGTTTPAYALDVYGNARLGTSTASSLFFRGLANFNNNFYINTSGNVATGTWQGTPIGVSFGGTGTSTNFTTGSIIFASANGIYSQNNAKLFWDNTNLRLGIGTTTPATTLGVYGISTFMGGRVGIGTTVPGGKLSVTGNTSAGSEVKFEVLGTLSASWDVSSAVYLQEISVAAKETSPQGVFFKPDGTKMYTIGYDGNTVDEYNLSTAWSVITAVYLQEISVAAKETDPTGVFFKPDGTKMYTIGQSDQTVDEYNLSTAWSVTSAVYLQEFSVADKEAIPTGVFFKPDGTKMYTVGFAGDTVDEYNLSTAWSVITAVYFQEISVSAKETSLEGVFFKPDGTKMYTIGFNGRTVDEYNLSTAWSVITAVYLQEFSVAAKEIWPSGVFFKPDGTKMYTVGSNGITVDEYDLIVTGDLLNISNGTNSHLVVSNQGNVGIGTTTPSALLDVYASSTAYALNVNQIMTGGIVNFRNATGSVFTILNNGNVGIGTTSPAYLLDVYGNVRLGASSASQIFLRAGTTTIMSGNVGIGTMSPGEKLQVDGNITVLQTNATEKYIGFSTPNSPSYDGTRIGSYHTADWGGDLRFYTLPSGGSGSDFERMRITTTGNVGIGTTTPTSLLEVYSSTANTDLTITAATSTTYDSRLVFRTGATPTTKFVLGVDLSDSNKFKIATSTLGTGDLLTIDYGTGNVGIGTTSPATTLQVYGTSTFMGGNVGIGTTTPAYTLDVYGNIRYTRQLFSTVATGTAPLVVASGAKVANLNADLLDGFDSSAFGDATVANQVKILNYIGTSTDAASMSTTLFAGQEYIADKLYKTPSMYLTNATHQGNHNCDDTPANCCDTNYHMCSGTELIGGGRTLETTGTGRHATPGSGNEGWTNWSSSIYLMSYAVSDCNKWSINTINYFGGHCKFTYLTVFDSTNRPYYCTFGDCNNSKRVWCCSN